LPKFKSEPHVGVVAAWQIGSVKKEIIFKGDVHNTSARIRRLLIGFFPKDFQWNQKESFEKSRFS